MTFLCPYVSNYSILKSNGCHSSVISASFRINYIQQYLWFSGLLQKQSETRPFKTVMKIIITQLPTSCATETYVTKSASQEMPGQGSKYKMPPTSSIGQPRLHHYSGFPPLFSVSSHIRPYPLQHPVPHPLHFLQATSSPSWLKQVSADRMSRE